MIAPKEFTVKIQYDADDNHAGWFAQVVELPGCMTEADTIAELGPMVADAINSWIDIAMEDKIALPKGVSLIATLK